MADLDPAHVEAVALVVDPAAFRHASQAWEAQRGVALLTAEAILTSTDTAVHAALLAALVRAGVLHREVDGICDDEERVVISKESRYVTEWEAL